MSPNTLLFVPTVTKPLSTLVETVYVVMSYYSERWFVLFLLSVTYFLHRDLLLF